MKADIEIASETVANVARGEDRSSWGEPLISRHRDPGGLPGHFIPSTPDGLDYFGVVCVILIGLLLSGSSCRRAAKPTRAPATDLLNGWAITRAPLTGHYRIAATQLFGFVPIWLMDFGGAQPMLMATSWRGTRMRRLMMAAAIVALAGAGSLIAGSAPALPGVGGLQATGETGLVQKAQVVCPRPYWNGWRWVQPPCRPAFAPRVYAPIGPPVVVVRPWRRPRPYYY